MWERLAKWATTFLQFKICKNKFILQNWGKQSIQIMTDETDSQGLPCYIIYTYVDLDFSILENRVI